MEVRRDVKEILGTLMRVTAGGEITEEELGELSFTADGALLEALDEAYIMLMEFAFDREQRERDRPLDAAARAGLQGCIDKIVDLCERSETSTSGAARPVDGGGLHRDARAA